MGHGYVRSAIAYGADAPLVREHAEARRYYADYATCIARALACWDAAARCGFVDC